MSIYSSQVWYCNSCGKQMFTPPVKAIIARPSYTVCSIDCSREMSWKHTLSTLGEAYYIQNKAYK